MQESTHILIGSLINSHKMNMVIKEIKKPQCEMLYHTHQDVYDNNNNEKPEIKDAGNI